MSLITPSLCSKTSKFLLYISLLPLTLILISYQLQSFFHFLRLSLFPCALRLPFFSFFFFVMITDPVGNVYNCKSNMKNELYFWLQKASSLINKVQTRFTDDDIMSHSWFCSDHSIWERVKGNRIWVGFVKRSTIFSRITLICSMNSSALFQIRFLLKPLPISHVLLTCKLCPSKEILCSRRFKAVYVGRIIITTTFWSVFTATLLDI